MAMRQSRPRTRAQGNSDIAHLSTRSRLDPDNVANWDIATLRSKLGDMNIALGGNVTRKALVMLYQANVGARSMTGAHGSVFLSEEDTHTTTSAPVSRETFSNSKELNVFSHNERARDGIDNDGTPSTMIRTSSAIPGEDRQLTSASATTMAALHREMQQLSNLVRSSHTAENSDALANIAKPPDSLPMIPDTVSPMLRRQIVEGKLVNLAELLIPNSRSQDCRTSECDGQSFAIKDDNRLNKILTQGEFHSAFLAYKKILCEAFPGQYSMMDAYQQHITDMAAQYGGSLFYEYHKMFAAKAAAWMAKGVLVDWGLVDTRIYTTVTSGYRSRSCGLCHSLCHLTDFCPQLKLLTSSSIRRSTYHPYVCPDHHPGGQNQDRGRDICKNVNSSDTRCLRGISCHFRHACLVCQRPGPGCSECD